MAQMLIAPTDQLTDERLPVGGVTDGIEVQLLGPDGEPVKTDEVGEIVSTETTSPRLLGR